MQEGWKCPVCGCGVAPQIERCPCNMFFMAWTSCDPSVWYTCSTCNHVHQVGEPCLSITGDTSGYIEMRK